MFSVPQWSPARNVIACYVPGEELGDKPARVILIEIPSRKVLRSHNLFKVIVSAGASLLVEVLE